jgi:hypothetical protein
MGEEFKKMNKSRNDRLHRVKGRKIHGIIQQRYYHIKDVP